MKKRSQREVVVVVVVVEMVVGVLEGPNLSLFPPPLMFDLVGWDARRPGYR
ncbi:hypothetical protein QJS10_CPA09g00904 [Acorus calamus]|uniref:Uncharacterized protein n=1 Tax=Acorus calamus TaxID=4465 RepID=A0AAV9E3X0_ACOCL|nr:hypothetical protein QJS10_CPA09g00904 [Acorus calamus]